MRFASLLELADGTTVGAPRSGIRDLKEALALALIPDRAIPRSYMYQIKSMCVVRGLVSIYYTNLCEFVPKDDRDVNNGSGTESGLGNK